MAIYVPDMTSRNVNALLGVANSFGQLYGQRRQAALQQLRALQTTGANAQQMAAPLRILETGGNPFRAIGRDLQDMIQGQFLFVL